MRTRTVQLDDEAVKTLGPLRGVTGLSISGILTEGLKAPEAQAVAMARRKPYDNDRQR